MPENTKKAPPVNDALRLYRASRARQNERRTAELAKAVASLTSEPAKEPAKRGRPPNQPPPPPPPAGAQTPPPDGNPPPPEGNLPPPEGNKGPDGETVE